jgi:EAL domain-containing protein (putative c-di-GMP-specific phosphodiesterase class I)
MGLEAMSTIPFDFVKVDQGLLARAMRDSCARGVLVGILAIAQASGCFLIAKGIESVEDFDFISHFHESDYDVTAVTGMQGHLLGMPRTGAPEMTKKNAALLSLARDFV